MPLFIEKYSHLLVGIVAFVASFWLVSEAHLPSSESIRDLLTAVINVSAIAVGFLATAKSILFSIEKKRVIRQLKGVPEYYDLLITYLMSATKFAFLVSVVTACSLLIEFKQFEHWHVWFFRIWGSIVILTAWACYRVIHIFGKILLAKD